MPGIQSPCSPHPGSGSGTVGQGVGDTIDSAAQLLALSALGQGAILLAQEP